MSIAKKCIPLPFCNLARSSQERRVRLINEKTAGDRLENPEAIKSSAYKQLTALELKNEYIIAVKLQGKNGPNQRALGTHMLKALHEAIGANDGINTLACIAGRDQAIAHYQTKRTQHAVLGAMATASVAGMIVSAVFHTLPGIVCCAVVCAISLVGYGRTLQAQSRLNALRKGGASQRSPSYERFISVTKQFNVLRSKINEYQKEHDRLCIENDKLKAFRSARLKKRMSPHDRKAIRTVEKTIQQNELHIRTLRVLSQGMRDLDPSLTAVGRLFNQLEGCQAQGQTMTKAPLLLEIDNQLNLLEGSLQKTSDTWQFLKTQRSIFGNKTQ